MIDDRQDELAALHALDLLEGAERELFVAEMAGNAELRRRVAELRQVGSSLAHLAPAAEPPAGLKARILASAGPRAASAGAKAPPPRAAQVVPFPAWVPWLAAAALAVAALWSQKRYVSTRGDYDLLRERQRVAQEAIEEERKTNQRAQAEIGSLRTQQQLAQEAIEEERKTSQSARTEIDSLRTQQRLAQEALDQTRAKLTDAGRLLADSGRQIADLDAKLKAEGDIAHFKITTLASMLGNSPAALAVAVWDPNREQGVLSVSKLPAVAAAKDYQLWVIDSAYPAPVSAGVFAVDPVTGEAHVVFRANKPVKSIAKFAVSVERKGGAPEPEGPIVLLGQ